MKLLIVLLMIVGCSKKPVSTEQTNNNEFQVELLFTHDGCKVFRFYDGYTRYFTNCDSTSWTEGCGKGCTRPVEIQNNKGSSI